MSENLKVNKKTRKLAFLGWLSLPVFVTWMISTLFELDVLWWGPTWFILATGYMIIYFSWVKKQANRG